MFTFLARQVDIERINEDLPAEKSDTPDDKKFDKTIGSSEINKDETLQSGVPAVATINNLPIAPQRDEITDSEIKKDEKESSPVDTGAIPVNESSQSLDVEKNDGNAHLYQGKAKKSYKKKQQKYAPSPAKYLQTSKLHRIAELDSFIDVLLDSLMFANEDFEDGRDIFDDPFSYFTPMNYFNWADGTVTLLFIAKWLWTDLEYILIILIFKTCGL